MMLTGTGFGVRGTRDGTGVEVRGEVFNFLFRAPRTAPRAPIIY